MSDHEARVAYLTASYNRREKERHDFAVKHGFALKRSQNFKGCLLIRWKHRKRKDENFIDHDRINEYTDFMIDVRNKYGLWDENHPLLGFELAAYEAGIYCFHEWDHRIWAIPDEYKEVQEYVLKNMPKWAVVTKKE